MIKIEKPYDGQQCNCCHSSKDVLDVLFRSDYNNQGHAVALCRECRTNLREILNKDLQKKPTDEVIVIPEISSNGAYVDADFYAVFHCPICGEYVGQDDEETHFNFCPVCGQAIDWSEEEHDG